MTINFKRLQIYFSLTVRSSLSAQDLAMFVTVQCLRSQMCGVVVDSRVFVSSDWSLFATLDFASFPFSHPAPDTAVPNMSLYV